MNEIQITEADVDGLIQTELEPLEKAHQVTEFLSELTALSHQHGIGIKDGELYELEVEDGERRYSSDEESKLDFV